MSQFDKLEDIPHYTSWVKIQPIMKGWSSDKKYYLEDENGEKMLLRITDISQYQLKLQEYENIKTLAKLGINISNPLDFGTCANGTRVYSLFTWMEGEDAEDVLPNQSITNQYRHGVNAGKILRTIHSIPAPINQSLWEPRFKNKIQHKLNMYAKCKIKFDHDVDFIQFIHENKSYLANRPQVLHHGDFHTGNLIISKEDRLGVVDFNRGDYGDPWEEFNRCIFSWRVSVPFTIGQIHGYFNNNVPDLFFRLMTLYVVTNAVGSIHWAIPYGKNEVEFMLKNAENIFQWYDGFKTYIPLWYKGPN
ncbi:aminoglycoside phosphotransferase family protein [Promethearchaeum syntrophicum]|uniref:Aminoglycoside phosphotransferase family protein n=1 Tax=Promethearchaeum syntrophicum TaxID=2594042 RepID=A0A5B9D6W3_9ARCH|nr:phosphotransferase [Candidatus Prometheoarchaeum syntrophicum]QEE14711.1 Phosphotransferase enzyme family protein [Candidatus Prometheoarchaeum syntrophicum]